MELGDQDKLWTHHKMCKNCTEALRFSTQGNVKATRFVVPTVWREPQNHCYLIPHCGHGRMELSQEKLMAFA